jgi:hypothetical protein
MESGPVADGVGLKLERLPAPIIRFFLPRQAMPHVQKSRDMREPIPFKGGCLVFFVCAQQALSKLGTALDQPLDCTMDE